MLNDKKLRYIMMDQIQEEIIEEFSVFEDWLDKYDYLIGLSEEVPQIAAEHRTDQYVIEGCQSRVWVDAELRDGKVYFAADSDAIITILFYINLPGNRSRCQQLFPILHRLRYRTALLRRFHLTRFSE